MKPRLSVLTSINIQIFKIIISKLAIRADIPLTHVPRPSNIFRLLVSTISCLLLFQLFASAQTSILVVVNPTEIVIGADSKIQVEDKGQLIVTTVPTCKVYQVNGVVFAGANLITSRTGYNAYAIAIKVLDGNGKFLDKVAQFERRIHDPLLKTLIGEKQNNPKSFKENLEGLIALDVVFATFEGGSPIVSFRRFICKKGKGDKVSIDIKRKDCSGDCAKGFYRFLGHGEAANNWIAKHPSIWNRGIAEAVRHLIWVEIEDQPRYVGGPIDILRMSKDETCWVGPKTKKSCDDEKIEVCKAKQ